MKRIGSAEDYEKFIEELYSPLSGRDPDKVSESVVESEMDSFYKLQRES